MDVMIDVESLGNEGKFLVLSVAAVPFRIGNQESSERLIKEGHTFYEKIDFADSIIAGYEVDLDTIDWWRKQNPEVFRDQFVGGLLIDQFCLRFEQFITELKGKYSCHTIDFYTTARLDYTAIANLYRSQLFTNIKSPVSYKSSFCARTIRNEAIKKAKKTQTNFRTINNQNTHNPIEDCINQIGMLNEEYNFIFGK